MYKAAVFGDYDSIYGFAAVGLDIYPTEPDEAAKALESLCSEERGYAVIYITERYAVLLAEQLEKYSTRVLPAIIPIPGVSGNTGIGIANVKKMVEKAVGSDIIFGNDK